MDDQHVRDACNQRDRLEVLEQVVVQFRIEGLADGGRRPAREERIAVGRRARGQLGRDIAAGAGTVVDHDLLAQRVAHFGRDQAHRDVHARAGCKADEDAHRFGGIGLRVERGRDCCRRNDGECFEESAHVASVEGKEVTEGNLGFPLFVHRPRRLPNGSRPSIVAPLFTMASISASLNPTSFSTSTLCWPSFGAGFQSFARAARPLVRKPHHAHLAFGRMLAPLEEADVLQMRIVEDRVRVCGTAWPECRPCRISPATPRSFSSFIASTRHA